MPVIEIGSIIGVVTTIFAVYVSHLLSKARMLSQQAQTMLKDYRMHRRRLAAHIASKLADMKEEEEIAQFITQTVFKYRDLTVLAGQVRELIEGDYASGAARSYLLGGAAALLYLTGVAWSINDTGTVLLFTFFVAGIIVWLGYTTEKRLASYNGLVAKLEEYLTELQEEMET